MRLPLLLVTTLALATTVAQSSGATITPYTKMISAVGYTTGSSSYAAGDVVLWDAEIEMEDVSLGDTAVVDPENTEITSVLGPPGLVFDVTNWDVFVTHFSSARFGDPDDLNPRLLLFDQDSSQGYRDLFLWGYQGNRGPGTDGWDAGIAPLQLRGNQLEVEVAGVTNGTQEMVGKVIGYAVRK